MEIKFHIQRMGEETYLNLLDDENSYIIASSNITDALYDMNCADLLFYINTLLEEITV